MTSSMGSSMSSLSNLGAKAYEDFRESIVLRLAVKVSEEYGLPLSSSRSMSTKELSAAKSYSNYERKIFRNTPNNTISVVPVNKEGLHLITDGSEVKWMLLTKEGALDLYSMTNGELKSFFSLDLVPVDYSGVVVCHTDLNNGNPKCSYELEAKMFSELDLEVLRAINECVGYDYLKSLEVMSKNIRSKPREGELHVSDHAVTRYMERRLCINDVPRYRSSMNKEQVNNMFQEVRDQVAMAVLVWEEPDTMTEVYLAEDNFLYVVVNNKVVTAYRKSFGFVPEIDRNIIFSQLAVIKGLSVEIAKAEEEVSEVVGGVTDRIDMLQDQLDYHKAKVEEITTEMEKSKLEVNVARKGLTALKKQYDKEYNLIFKEFKVGQEG